MTNNQKTPLANFLAIVVSGTLYQIKPFGWYSLAVYYVAAATIISFALGVPWWKGLGHHTNNGNR